MNFIIYDRINCYRNNKNKKKLLCVIADVVEATVLPVVAWPSLTKALGVKTFTAETFLFSALCHYLALGAEFWT